MFSDVLLTVLSKNKQIKKSAIDMTKTNSSLVLSNLLLLVSGFKLSINLYENSIMFNSSTSLIKEKIINF